MIIKGLDNQTQVYKYVCLIIKSLDTQVQKLHNQINQCPRKSLISYPDVVETARARIPSLGPDDQSVPYLVVKRHSFLHRTLKIVILLFTK